MKTIHILCAALCILLLMILPTAMASDALPLTIEGNGSGFRFDTASGKVTVPDCVLESAHAFRTTWDIDESFFSSGEAVMIFEHLARAKVSAMPEIAQGPYDNYEYAGIELFVRSDADSDIAARLRLQPRNQDDYPEYQNLVDLEIVLYNHYNQPDEQRALRVFQLESYDLWNSIVRYTMNHCEPDMLKDIVAIELHSLQNDPSARATPSESPQILDDATAIHVITALLANTDPLEHNMAAMDYLHLRLVRKDAAAIDIYLQDPNAVTGGHFEAAPDDDQDHIYVQMGGYCYRLNRIAIQSALQAAGIPLEMMV